MSRTVKSVLIALAVCASLTFGVIIALSLQPDKPPPPVLPFVDVKLLPPHGMLTLDTDSFRYFVLRSAQGEPYVVAAPFHEGAVLMPEVYWWKPFYYCRDFGIKTADGIVPSDAQFQCHDTSTPTQWQDSWRWNLQGRNQPAEGAKGVENMHRVRTRLEGDKLVFVGLLID